MFHRVYAFLEDRLAVSERPAIGAALRLGQAGTCERRTDSKRKRTDTPFR